MSPIKRSAAIVGAGPAGLMAAETLAAAGLAVTIHERMPSPARKFLMAGRGGLNLTHSEPIDRFIARYGKAADWMAPLLGALPPAGLVAWCEGLGEATFIGSSGRVFPRSFKASPLLRAWLARLAGLGVLIETRSRFLGWGEDGRLRFASPAGETSPAPDVTILAMGGASWPRLGSDGSWVRVLEGAGVAVAPLSPANVGLLVDWSPVLRERFHGEPLKRIALTHEGRSVKGEAVLTRGGLEGGAAYALGASIRAALRNGPTRLLVDLRPDLSHEALAAKLSGPRAGASTATILRKRAGLSPAAAGVAREAGPLPADPDALARRIKQAELTVKGLSDFDRAISSAGGIRLDGLDSRLMLAARPGVFAAGEMLDWEAPTGGYLFQASFASGMGAARGALDWLAERDARAAADAAEPSHPDEG
jgi:uncharacterized flavoprotein (TIGR03862 family)